MQKSSVNDSELNMQNTGTSEIVIACVGNPNVGKSNVFNALVEWNRHTENRPGQTDSNAQSECILPSANYRMVNLPDVGSFLAHSADEEAARDFICFGGADAVVVVCDAACLEQDLNLVLQTTEIMPNVVACIHSMQEAGKKHMKIDCTQLEKCLGVPVAVVNVKSGKGFASLMKRIGALVKKEEQPHLCAIRYIRPIEKAISILEPTVRERIAHKRNSRWIALKLIDNDATLITALNQYLNCDILSDTRLSQKVTEAQNCLADCGISGGTLRDNIASCIALAAEQIYYRCVSFGKSGFHKRNK